MHSIIIYSIHFVISIYKMKINHGCPIIVTDGRNYISFVSIELLLSWIDYEQLGLELIDMYHGNVIISVGNYEDHGNNKYLYKLINRIIVKMPWNRTEVIEIYERQ